MNSIFKKNEAFNIIISGYGSPEDMTLAQYHFESSGEYQRLWHNSIHNASFVTKSDDYLFTVTEQDDFCAVYMFKKQENGYELLDQRKLEGGALCHITYSPRHKVLYGACYGTGTVFAIRVADLGFGELIFSEIQHIGEEQELTRAHCVLLNGREDELLTVNIALDLLFCYQLKEGIPYLDHTIALPKGVGPRHVIFSQEERYLYIITEYSNEIFVYDIEKEEFIQRISTLSEGYTGVTYCSTLCSLDSGRYLYAANRGADTIMQFRIDTDNRLIRVKEYSCGGKHPRHMMITENDELLIICNQYSDLVVAYHIDQETGGLTEKAFELAFGNPSGILQE